VAQGVAPRKPLGYGANDIAANLGSGFCAMQNVGIWGISALRNADPNFEYGVFKLPLPPGGQDRTVAGGWAFVANANGRDTEAAGKFCAWALGSMEPGSVKRVADWCTKAKSDMPPRKSAFAEATAAQAYGSGAMKSFAEQVFPTARGEPRVPPQVYKAISDAIQACQLNGEDPGKRAEMAAQQIDSFLAGYDGAPIL
jgi:multiple sugar transport system substrate-binding protein